MTNHALQVWTLSADMLRMCSMLFCCYPAMLLAIVAADLMAACRMDQVLSLQDVHTLSQAQVENKLLHELVLQPCCYKLRDRRNPCHHTLCHMQHRHSQSHKRHAHCMPLPHSLPRHSLSQGGNPLCMQ